MSREPSRWTDSPTATTWAPRATATGQGAASTAGAASTMMMTHVLRQPLSTAPCICSLARSKRGYAAGMNERLHPLLAFCMSTFESLLGMLARSVIQHAAYRWRDGAAAAWVANREWPRTGGHEASGHGWGSQLTMPQRGADVRVGGTRWRPTALDRADATCRLARSWRASGVDTRDREPQPSISGSCMQIGFFRERGNRGRRPQSATGILRWLG